MGDVFSDNSGPGAFQQVATQMQEQTIAKQNALNATKIDSIARNDSIFSQKEQIRKRLASQTLFSGGMGLTETPKTASSILIGN